jgi:hypothetical protein
MGKSFRRTPIIGHGSDSEKKDKRINNRKFRRCEHMLIAAERFDDLPICMHEIANEWCMSKDGKSWIGNMKNGFNKHMRFNYTEEEIIEIYKKCMRK